MKILILILVTFTTIASMHAQDRQPTGKKMKILIHITQGPENPTRAALAFLVARSAIEEGHAVDIFLAGDAVSLFRAEVLESLTGTGTGKLIEHYRAIAQGGGKFYLSGASAKARGLTEKILKDKPAEFAMPNILVRLAVESDKMFVY
jgi:uncharacterized protein